MDIQRAQPKRILPKNAHKVFEGKIFNVYQWEQEQFDGSFATYEYLKRKGDSVNVFPITKGGKIILGQQEQPGRAPFIGGLGGKLEPGEDPLTGVKRELLEESGYKANDWIFWFSCQPDSKTDWVVYTFIAKNLKKTEHSNLDAGEKIELIEVTFDEFIDITKRRDFRDSEVALEIYRSSSEPEKMAEIRKLFSQ